MRYATPIARLGVILLLTFLVACHLNHRRVETGIPVSYHKDYVRSPYTTPPRLVKLQGASAGQIIVCPYTKRPFIVPSSSSSNPSPTSTSSLATASHHRTRAVSRQNSSHPRPAPSKQTPPPQPNSLSQTESKTHQLPSEELSNPSLPIPPEPLHPNVKSVTSEDTAQGVDIAVSSSSTPASNQKHSTTPRTSHFLPESKPNSKTELPRSESQFTSTSSESKSAKINAPDTTASPITNSTEVKPSATTAIPFGEPIPGKPGYVRSPYAQPHQLVDVVGLAPGSEVKCPYSNKIFRIPLP